MEPGAIVAKLCGKLKPGGYIWIAFPSSAVCIAACGGRDAEFLRRSDARLFAESGRDRRHSACERSERVARGAVARRVLDHDCGRSEAGQASGEEAVHRKVFWDEACGTCWDLKITCLGSADRSDKKPGRRKESKGTMKSRREFLKDAATGAMALGSAAATEKLGFAGMLGQQSAEHATTGRSRVVIARDASLEGRAHSLMSSAS